VWAAPWSLASGIGRSALHGADIPAVRGSTRVSHATKDTYTPLSSADVPVPRSEMQMRATPPAQRPTCFLSPAYVLGQRRMAPKILMVLSSHSELGNTGKKTGFWLEEFAAPFYVFKDAGAEITLASPKGGAPPLDPASEGEQFQTDATRRYKDDKDAAALLASTVKLETCDPAAFDAVFYPGGHGPMWDLAEDPTSIKLIEGFWASGKAVSAVCHGVAALRHCKTKCPYGGEEMKYIIDNKRMTGFTNSEEQAVGLSGVVPFSLEDELKGKGADFSAGDDWAPRVCVHGKLITGQNPASSEQTANEVLRLLSGGSPSFDPPPPPCCCRASRKRLRRCHW